MGNAIDAYKKRINEARQISRQQITQDDQRFTERELRSASTDTHQKQASPDFLERLRTRLPLNLSNKYSS